MADDDESVYRATRAAADRARQKLVKARSHVTSAGREFSGGVGLASWGSLSGKLAKRKACATSFTELQAAIRAAEAAIAHAEAACDALTRATRQTPAS